MCWQQNKSQIYAIELIYIVNFRVLNLSESDRQEHEDRGVIIQSKGDVLQADVERGQLRKDGFGVGAQRVI